MIQYPVLRRTSFVRSFEFDDVEYTVALLYAMAHCLGANFQATARQLDLTPYAIEGLLEDAPCNHCLPFSAAVNEMLARFGAHGAHSIPDHDEARTATQIPALFVGIAAFNTDLDEAAVLSRALADGTLDWLISDDFRTLPVPLNEVVADWRARTTLAPDAA